MSEIFTYYLTEDRLNRNVKQEEEYQAAKRQEIKRRNDLSFLCRHREEKFERKPYNIVNKALSQNKF